MAKQACTIWHELLSRDASWSSNEQVKCLTRGLFWLNYFAVPSVKVCEEFRAAQ